LADHLFLGNQLVIARLAAMTHRLVAYGYDPASAKAAAYALLDNTMQAQALTMSYNDAFLVLGLTMLAASPAVFLLRKPNYHAATPAHP
jgi:hypothetical protein